jgi:predicted molibdopterin-dependent oxidoreductase YjgC
MIVLANYDAKTINKTEMDFYCSSYCKYNSVCDGKNKSFKLQSTIQAIEMRNARKNYPLDYANLPYRSEQLAYIVDSIISKETMSNG